MFVNIRGGRPRDSLNHQSRLIRGNHHVDIFEWMGIIMVDEQVPLSKRRRVKFDPAVLVSGRLTQLE